jgi:TonB-dependent Receptor Plug Domain
VTLAKDLRAALPSCASRLFCAGLLALTLATQVRAQEDDTPRPPQRVAPSLLAAPPVHVPDGVEPPPDDLALDLVVTVALDGGVSAVELATPYRDDLDRAILDAARAMRFSPALRDGVPTLARIRFRYRVRTDRPGPPPLAVPEDPFAEPFESTTPESPSQLPEADAQPPQVETQAEAAVEPVFGARARVDPPEAGAATRITLRAEELSTVPGTLGEPLRVVAALPGVVRSPFGLGFFVVRGANFQNTGFLIDGFPVPLLYHFGAGPAVIPTLFVDRLHFYPGNYPVRWGRYTGGIVGIDVRTPRVRTYRIDVSLDLLRASATAIVPFDEGRGSVAIGFRRSYYELLFPLFIKGLDLQYTDYQGRVEYDFGRGFSGSLLILGSDDHLDQSGAIGGGATSSGSNSYIGINFQRAIARLDLRLDAESSLRLSGTVGRDGQFFGSNNVGQPSQRFGIESFTTGLRFDAHLRTLPWLAIDAGLDLAGSSVRIDVTAPAPAGLGEYPRPISDPQLISLRSAAARGLPGAYLEGVMDFEPVQISLGVRSDVLRYGTVTNGAVDPRLVVRWQIVREFLVKAATGIFTQPPLAIQTVATGGNPRLGVEHSFQNSLGTELDLPSWALHAEVNGYYSHMYDVARFSQRLVAGDDGQIRREFFRADGLGRAYGLEVLIRRPVEEGFYFWLSYTLSRSERTNSSGQWVLFNQDQEHVLNLVASYEYDGWRFGARFTLATGRPTAAITRGVYDADANSYDAVLDGQIARLPTYHQLDLRIDKEWQIGIVRGTVYLDVLNVYNAQNAEGVIYQYDYQRSTPLPGIPVVGTLGVQVRIEE